MKTCNRLSDHRLPTGLHFAGRGCKHEAAESMRRADFGRLPMARCVLCSTALGRVCPECHRVY